MFMATLAEVIAERRRSLNLTQRKVASEAGISAGYLGMIESGKVGIPSPGVMASLARTLGIPEDELLQSVGYLQDEEAISTDEKPESVLLRIAALPSPSERLDAINRLPRREYESLLLLMHDLFASATGQLAEQVQQQRNDPQE